MKNFTKTFGAAAIALVLAGTSLSQAFAAPVVGAMARTGSNIDLVQSRDGDNPYWLRRERARQDARDDNRRYERRHDNRRNDRSERRRDRPGYWNGHRGYRDHRRGYRRHSDGYYYRNDLFQLLIR